VSERSAALVDEGKVCIESGPWLYREGAVEIFFYQIIEMEVVGEEAPVEAGALLEVGEGE
jgi:hypothetical protein